MTNPLRLPVLVLDAYRVFKEHPEYRGPRFNWLYPIYWGWRLWRNA